MKYILHSYRRCPFCIRVRILLHLKGVKYEIVEEPLRKWTQWMIDWSQESGERPRVPVLEVHHADGHCDVVTESHDINIMIDQTHGNTQYIPTDEVLFAQMQEWVQWSDDVFKHQIDTYKYGRKNGQERGSGRTFDPETHPQNTKDLSVMMEKIEKRLIKNKALVGDQMTLADIAIIPFVRQIMRTREGEFDFSDFPQTVAWANIILAQEWFQDVVMKKRQLAPAHNVV